AQVPHQNHPPSSGEYAKVLEDPSRDEWQKPHDVVMALRLKSTDAIADIGAGTGYFARRFANHAGKVYAVDIDPELLAIAGKNAPANLKTVLAAPDDPRLPEHSVDIVFFCDVLHHIKNRAAYYPKLAKALKAGGRGDRILQEGLADRAATVHETLRRGGHRGVGERGLYPRQPARHPALSVLPVLRQALTGRRLLWITCRCPEDPAVTPRYLTTSTLQRTVPVRLCAVPPQICS